MNPEEILQLLEQDEALRQFIIAYHTRLALDNPGREIAERTADEQVMDAFGRLLVGDETCVAILARDNSIELSSNLDEHSSARASFIIKGVTFLVNQDGTRVKATATVDIRFLLDDGTEVTIPYEQEVDFGEYKVSAQEGVLKLINDFKPHCEITYKQHGIDHFPFPIRCEFEPQPQIPVSLLGDRSANRKIQLKSLPETESIYSVRLDPLFRRAAVVFSHLGLLCLLGTKTRIGQQLVDDFIHKPVEQLSQNRMRVLRQTLGWEAASLYNLSKTKRSYNDQDLPRSQRKQRETKRKEIAELEQFIDTITLEMNTLIASINQAMPLSLLIKRWKDSLRQRIYAKKIVLPDIIANSRYYSTDRFLDLACIYFGEILFLEQRMSEWSTRSPNQLTATLACIAEEEMLGRTNMEASLSIIDADLSKGTHAEIRLFYEFMIKKQQQAEFMPYIGITQLCCASCNTLLNGHGLRHVQGSKHRAGLHGTHYPGWKLDSRLQTEAILKPFFGEELFEVYSKLQGEIVSKNKSYTRQQCACAVIQDLAALWYKATPERLKRIQSLGFTHGAIACDQSNYPDPIYDPSHSTLTSSQETRYISMEHFKQALQDRFSLQIDQISGDGNCQFRAFVRGLQLLSPNEYNSLSSNIAEQGFTFFEANQREDVATYNIRQEATQYMRDNADKFHPFLVEEENIHFATVDEFSDYMEQEGIYGNNLTLQAMAMYHQRPIIILQPGVSEDTPVTAQIITPNDHEPVDLSQALILLYNGVDHYELILHTPNQIFSDELIKLIAEKNPIIQAQQNKKFEKNH